MTKFYVKNTQTNTFYIRTRKGKSVFGKNTKAKFFADETSAFNFLQTLPEGKVPVPYLSVERVEVADPVVSV